MVACCGAGGDFRVERVLKDGPSERTQVVYLLGAAGGEYGPFVHKVISSGRCAGGVYQTLHASWMSGRRFMHLPEVLHVLDRGDSLEVLMEYVGGPTLESYLASVGFERKASLWAFEDACRACMELHESFNPPIIHRDLKPSNIIMATGRHSSQPTAVLIDFGIARRWREGESSDTVHFGTRNFAPPEQYGFAQTTIRSDVYALGMLLSYCLVGSTVARERLVSALSEANVSNAMIGVIEKATAFDPSDRFESVEDLLAAFLDAAEEVVPSRGSRRALVEGGRGGGSLFTASMREKAPWTLPFEHRRIFDRPLIRISWNFLILLVAVVFIQASIELVIHPTNSMRDVSTVSQVIIVLFMVLPFFLFVLCLLYNKSWLRKRFSWIDRCMAIGLPRLIVRLIAYEALAMIAALLFWSF